MSRFWGARAPAVAFGIGWGLLSGCTPTVPEAEVVDLGECAGDADTDDTIRIAEEFEASAHEMIQCGNLTFQFIGAVIATAERWSGSPAEVPSAFSYDQGVYTTTGEGVRMHLTLHDAAGSPLGADVFDPDAFLVGADAQTSDGTTTVTFTEPGPLAGLIGQGQSPSSPLVLGEADLATFADNLGKLLLTTVIDVDDEVDTSRVTYYIEGDPVTLASAVLSNTMEMNAQSGSAERSDLEQQLTTTVWDVDFVEGVHQLVGTIEADVTGGPFPFHATYTYDGVNTYPLTELTCK